MGQWQLQASIIILDCNCIIMGVECCMPTQAAIKVLV